MSAVLGAATALVRVADEGALRRGVRLVFQPPRRCTPAGARADRPGRPGRRRLDPRPALRSGRGRGPCGAEVGPITSATDPVRIQVRGAGGYLPPPPHPGSSTRSARSPRSCPPRSPAAWTPRSGVNLTWGAIHASSAFNAIPSAGTLEGTLRRLDHETWDRAEQAARGGPRRPRAALGRGGPGHHDRGVPPVSNSPASVEVLAAAVRGVLGTRTSTPPHSPSAARTSPGTSRRCPAPWPASAPGPRADAPTTSTWETS